LIFCKNRIKKKFQLNIYMKEKRKREPTQTKTDTGEDKWTNEPDRTRNARTLVIWVK